MAANLTQLLFEISGNTAPGQHAVTDLKSHFGSELSAIEKTAEQTFEKLGEHLNLFVGERVPLVGGLFLRLTENIRGFHVVASTAEGSVLKLSKAIEDIATKSGKSVADVSAFIGAFGKLENQAQKDAAAITFFGESIAQKLIPHLDRSAKQMALLSEKGVDVSGALGGATAAAEGSTASFAGLGTVIGVVAIAAVAAAAAAVGLGVAIFEVVKKSAEVGLELEHLVEQTGLTAKTITALKFASDESGKSIEGFDRGMKLFENTVAAAAEGSDKAAAALKRLGITPKEALTDLDGALAKVFKRIYDAPPGIEKVSLSTDAFGKRIGSNMIPLIEAFHGNLGELIKRADELGVTLDEKGIKSLADFQRNMNALQAQAKGLERTFAVEVAPTLTQFLKDLSKFVAENKSTFTEWGVTVAQVFRGIRAVADSELGTIIKWLAWLEIQLAKFTLGIDVLQKLGAGVKTADTEPGHTFQGDEEIRNRKKGALEAGLGEDGFGPGKKKKGRTKKEADEDYKADLEASAEAAKQEAETQRHLTEQLRLEHERGLQDLNDYYSKEQKLADDHLAAVLADIKRQEGAVTAARERGITKDSELDKKAAELDLKAREAQNKRDEEINKLTLEKDRAAVQAEVKLREQLSTVAQATREGEQKRVEDALNKQTITESQALARQLEFLKANQEERIGIITFELNAQSSSAERKAQLDTDKKVSEQKYTDEFKRLTKERIEAIGKEAAAAATAAATEAAGHLDARAAGRGAVGGAVGALLKSQTAAATPFIEAQKLISENFKQSSLSAQVFTAALQGIDVAAQGVAQGVGSMVEQFVLVGTASTSFQKMAAQIIASMASQATAQAAYQFASGLAWEALFWFTGNPQYQQAANFAFLAAAAFGAVGVVAAGLGRAVAGGQFQQQSAGSGATGGAGSIGNAAGGSTANQQPTTIIMGRNQIVEHVHTIRLEPGLMAKEVIRTLNSNDPNVNHVVNRNRN